MVLCARVSLGSSPSAPVLAYMSSTRLHSSRKTIEKNVEVETRKCDHC